MANIRPASKIANARTLGGIRTLEGAGALQSGPNQTIPKREVAVARQLDHECKNISQTWIHNVAGSNEGMEYNTIRTRATKSK